MVHADKSLIKLSTLGPKRYGQLTPSVSMVVGEVFISAMSARSFVHQPVMLWATACEVHKEDWPPTGKIRRQHGKQKMKSM